MAIASKKMIREMLDCGLWSAFDKDNERLFSDDLHLNPNSIDVTLGNHFISVCGSNGNCVEPSKADSISCTELFIPSKDRLVLQPGDMLLGVAQQRFDLGSTNWVQMYEGRSTTARIGLASHITAGFGDIGFDGFFTLELVNMSSNNIALQPGIRIGQIYFEKVTPSDRKDGYTGAYKNAKHECKPIPPKLGKERF